MQQHGFENMHGPRDFHTKSERERQILYDITYMRNLKYETNEPICRAGTDTDIENRPGDTGQRRRGWDELRE